MSTDNILTVENLRVVFNTRYGQTVAVENLGFSLKSGEVIAIVGESGSGKSVACYSLLGLVPMPPGRVESGRAIFQGRDLLALPEKELRNIRGRKIAMIFQDPMTSLNPNMRIVDQLIEVLVVHKTMGKKEARSAAINALVEVGIHNAEERIDQFPHQFSGGMRQRVMIAMALLGEPDLLIADEPTTALDVTVQAQILTLIKKLQQSRNLAVIFITHDLGVAAQMANHVLVMEKGRLVEEGETSRIFSTPSHDYTRKLLNAVLTTSKPASSHVINYQASPLLAVSKLAVSFAHYGGALFRRNRKVHEVIRELSINIYAGEILGLVGESGSGKSTLGKSIIKLVDAQAGTILFEGRDILPMDHSAFTSIRPDIQMIFQDPYASLNPRMTVFDTLAEPLLVHGVADKSNILEQVNQLLDDVGLDRRFIRKYPHEFSGGQRQRIAIARAIALKPKLIIADEPVSALDVTIRAQILALLLELTRKHHLTMLFISHDMSVIKYLCDRVIVMQKGHVVEEGETGIIFSQPSQPYTKQLLAAIPKL